MLTALILICSLAATPDFAACSPDNALDVMRMPVESASPTACLLQGQGLVAGSVLGRELQSDERVKILCIRTGKLQATLPR